MISGSVPRGAGGKQRYKPLKPHAPTNLVWLRQPKLRHEQPIRQVCFFFTLYVLQGTSCTLPWFHWFCNSCSFRKFHNLPKSLLNKLVSIKSYWRNHGFLMAPRSDTGVWTALFSPGFDTHCTYWLWEDTGYHAFIGFQELWEHFTSDLGSLTIPQLMVLRKRSHGPIL